MRHCHTKRPFPSDRNKDAFNVASTAPQRIGNLPRDLDDRPQQREGRLRPLQGFPAHHSLRAANAKNDERPLFVLVDVVDDEPEARWLSVCFYADMVNDPNELGDFVPSGLMGKDACCLNLEEDDPAMRDYILARLGEAAASAAK